MKRWLKFCSAVGVALSMQACAWVPPMLGGTAGYGDPQRNPLIVSSQNAIHALADGMARHELGDAPVLVATVVNVNQLSRSAPLGRTLSELYASQLSRLGFNVKELKLRGDVFIQEGTGELLLSREIRNIADTHKASAVLVGTYAQARQNVYISIKLVRTGDSRIVRSYDYALPYEADIQKLLVGN